MSKSRLWISWIPNVKALVPVSDVACKVPVGARDVRELNVIDILDAASVPASLTAFYNIFLTCSKHLLLLPCGLLGLLA